MKNSKLKFKIRLMLTIPLIIILSVLSYIYLPSITYALDTNGIDIGTALGWIDPATGSETKTQIREHRGYGLTRTSGGLNYEAAAGHTGIKDIDAFLKNTNNAYSYSWGWYFTLANNPSVFCQQHNTRLPDIYDKYLQMFHVNDYDTNDVQSTGETKEDCVDYFMNLADCSKTLEILWKDQETNTIETTGAKVQEKNLGFGIGEDNKMYQYTYVRVKYTPTKRSFDTMEGYIYSYSNGAAKYNTDPAQLATWAYKNTEAPNDLYYAAKAVTESLENLVKPAMSKTSDNTIAKNTGTVISGSNYKVGPIAMNGYTYRWSTHAKKYSGELICGIVEMKVELDNGKVITLNKASDFTYSYTDNSQLTFDYGYADSPSKHGYIYPSPNSKFYINLPISSCTGATSIKRITAKYIWHTTEGKGGDLDGVYDKILWESQGISRITREYTGMTSCTYSCHDCAHSGLQYIAYALGSEPEKEPNALSTYFNGSLYEGDPNKIYHEKWCGATGYCDKGKTYSHAKHGCDHGGSSYSCHTCWGYKGAEKHSECDDPHHSDSCYHKHKDSCKHKHTASCKTTTGNTTSITCGKNESSNYCGKTESTLVCGKSQHSHYSSCCVTHKPWVSATNPGCFYTNYCSDEPLDHCQHGHKDGHHTEGEGESWGAAHEDWCNAESTCSHGHHWCVRLVWKCVDIIRNVQSQRLMYVTEAKTYKHEYEAYLDNIPLVAKVEINKYIYNVNHIVSLGTDTSMSASDARKDLDETTKAANPVYVEFGDQVTFKIILKNYSAFGVFVKADDILPSGNFKFIKATLQGSSISSVDLLKEKKITIGANAEAEIQIVLQIEDKIGKYENKARIITRNGENKSALPDIDYLRTSEDDGPVVNHIEVACNGTKSEPKIESSDFYILNNYNTSVDKYVHKYDESRQNQNNNGDFTNEPTIVNADKTLKVSRENTSKTKENYTDTAGGSTLVDKRVVVNNTKEEEKKNHPVNVEKYETVTYAIKVTNESTAVTAASPTGNKPATQVRPSVVTDKMHEGLSIKGVTAKVYTSGNAVKQNSLGVGYKQVGTEGDLIVYEFTIDNKTILESQEYVIILVEATVRQSNMYLPSMENSAKVTMLTNVNNGASNDRDVTDRNISLNSESKEYIRMKDLVIAGKVWVDFNRDGLMNESTTADQRDFYNVDTAGMKGGIVVNLYRLNSQSSDNATKVRTTKTDADGFFTFSRNQAMTYYQPFNNTVQYNKDTYYQRVDKASGKDGNGNYTDGSEYYRYYIEYEYDGVMYKSTEFYAGMNNLKQNDGRYDAKYLIDSNAAELDEDREKFNKLYEYISYDVAYDLNMSTQNGGNLSFDKDGHISTLIENEARKMTAKSFVVKHDTSAILKACKTAMNSCGSAKWKQCSNHWDDWQVAISMGIIDESLYPNTTEGRKAAQAYLQSIYDSLSTSTSDDTQRIKYLWLYSFNGGVDNTIPETDYLKYINLGLELREDVDIALTKDVYSVKTTIDGEEVEYSLNQLDILNGEGSNRDYIIDKPYGLELYESDYKKRTDQYASQAVRDYKGTESELNVEVTYRMTLNNIPVRDDYKMSSSTDTKLFVKIHEILDLYDQNFMTYSNNNTVTVKTKNANGFLEDKTVKVSEAWYFKKGGSGTKYSISNADEVAKGAKPFYVEDPNGTYTKVALEVSNESSRGNGVFSNKANDFTNDGYKTMYIRGMDGIVLAEDEDENKIKEFDIYVKYTLDKDTADVKVSSSYSETKSKRSSSSINIDGDTLEFAVQGESSTSTNVQLHRALRIAEDDKDKKNGRGIENIAQINAYSVWYDQLATKPASIVDVDSNAGNIGVTNGEGSKNVGSADEISLYEDTAYKTGIEIAAENTENDPDDVNTRYGIKIITKLTDLTRKITGRVWDDSRTETLDTGSGNLYHGDGINESSKEASKKTKNEKAQSNILIDEGRYMKDKDDNAYTENVDIPVRNAKAEFVEIVQISADKYYEQVLTDVTWEQKQHDRTDKTGTYLLEGLTPGTYIVRFTYGDTVDAKEDGVEDVALANRDMQIFNGQDYKSTKYTMALENGQLSVDEVIRRFNQENTSDARDDEMRRLTVNKYSEVMTNEKAEILKGLVNNEIEGLGTRYGKDPGVKNTPDDLQTLTDNTYMEAETVEFTIKPEKLLAEAAYYREATPEERAKSGSKVTRVTYNDTNGIQVQKYTSKKNDIYYNALEIIKNSDIYDRAFAIYNLDFGIEYRPESQISLTKEINQMKLTAEDGTVLVDLFFDTSKTTEGKTIHSINKEKSKGLEVVQFITNDYTNFAQALIKDIQNEEDTQGFVYIQVDDEILQGATVEITYKFYAQNNSEIDLIRDTLDVIRYKENKQTNELVKSKGPEILDTTYTASGTAENILFAEMYKEDGHGDLYRTKQKLLINTGTDEGYFGRFVGYSYYTGEKFARDVVACLKFDKILDYIDTNLEFKQETNNELLENRFWTITNPTELKPYVYALRKGGIDLTSVGTLTNFDGQEYKALVVSVDDGLYDNMPDRIPDNAATLGNGIVNNKELSRFLLPEKADTTKDKTNSTGYIYLPTSKVIAAETDTDNLQYENIAEIVQFTTLTGRRTNFETTIGNANIHKSQKSSPSKGSPEFDTAALEPDTAATETITLTPPTGLMLSRRKIVNVVDVASKGVGITVIVAAVVAIVFGITTITSLIIKKRRIK